MKLAKSLDRLGTETAFSVLAEAKKLEAAGKPMIHLGLGQPDFKTPKHIVDGGIRRGTHVLKALSLGATACSFGKGFLFALSAGGQKGVEMMLQRMKEELRRDMILLGKKNIGELSKENIAFRD